MEEEVKNITVLIAGRPYPLKVRAAEEHAIRKVAKEINETINRFQMTYTSKDKQDCLSMALLTYAVDLRKHKSNETGLVDNKLEQIDSLLGHLLG